MKKLIIVLLLSTMLTSFNDLDVKPKKVNLEQLIEKEVSLYPHPLVNKEIIQAIVWRESRDGKFMYNSNSINVCYGYGQISDVLLDWVNYRGRIYYTNWQDWTIADLYSGFVNIRLTVWYYTYCLRHSDYNMTNALHKYNLGHNTKKKNWSYVRDVLEKYEALR